MQIEYDEVKRARTLAERGLDMADAGTVFDGDTITVTDDRRDYGEPRLITVGFLGERMVFVVWTPRGAFRRIISMGRPMSENSKSTDRTSKPDDDIPDMTTPHWRERFAAAPLRRGRPRSARPKVSTTIRLDADIVDHFKADGPGWQTRINEALRKVVERQ